jgi:hypothetical protein
MMDDAEAREFAAAFRAFLEWVHDEARGATVNEVTTLVTGFLGPERSGRSVVSRSLPVFEHVNLQTAVDAWSRDAGREVTVQGLMLPPHHGDVTLQHVVSGGPHSPLQLSSPVFVDLPNGPGSTLACLQHALLLVTDARGRYVIRLSAPHEHKATLDVEIAGLEVDAAQAVQARLAELRSELNVYRGHVLDVRALPGGGVSLDFSEVPRTPRADVILPETVLGRVERHAMGVAAHRDRLLDAGQHLKRGLLLYGPPGTGKTHTTRYLVGQMAGYTRLTLTGRALTAIGAVADLARELQPAVIVLEDVDLVAEERSRGPASTPVLFDLLDAMDGAAADADLLFLLTTNRADLLEPALAARPGRVDIAVQVDLPDADGRARLLELYGRSLPLQLSDADRAAIVERTQGVTASFLKELLRRSMLGWLAEDPAGEAITAAHVSLALDDLLDTTQQLTRSLLGVGVDPTTLPAGGGLGSLPPERPMRLRR